jgi:hypothetical protein
MITWILQASIHETGKAATCLITLTFGASRSPLEHICEIHLEHHMSERIDLVRTTSCECRQLDKINLHRVWYSMKPEGKKLLNEGTRQCNR